MTAYPSPIYANKSQTSCLYSLQAVSIGTCKESTHMGVSQHSKDVTQMQQQRPELPKATHTWHAVHQVLSAKALSCSFCKPTCIRALMTQLCQKVGEDLEREKMKPNEPGRQKSCS